MRFNRLRGFLGMSVWCERCQRHIRVGGAHDPGCPVGMAEQAREARWARAMQSEPAPLRLLLPLYGIVALLGLGGFIVWRLWF